MRILDLSISSELENIELIDTSIASICTDLIALSDRRAHEVKLAVAEWLTNIIKHSYNGQPGHSIQTILELTKTHLVITVVDQGQKLPKDVLQKLHTPTCCCPEQDCECGRGLYVIAQGMDQICCQRKKGRNIVQMTKFYNSIRFE